MPAAVIITEPFQGLTASYAAKLDAPGYPPVVLPHPISTKDAETVRRLGARAVPDVLERLMPR